MGIVGKVGADELNGGGDLLAGAGLGTLGEHRGGESGQSWYFLWVGGGPGPEQQPKSHDRQARFFHNGNPQTVAQSRGAPEWVG